MLNHGWCEVKIKSIRYVSNSFFQSSGQYSLQPETQLIMYTPSCQNKYYESIYIVFYVLYVGFDDVRTRRGSHWLTVKTGVEGYRMDYSS